ncbi:short-chain dehydrogenase/reductase SDR [Meredithblackwellia eburnea MCA 4105]
MSSAAARVAAVSSHLSGNFSSGLLKDEVVIITGAGQGIGRETALVCAREGAKVVVSDLDASKGQAVVDEIKKAGGTAIAVAGDVTSAEFPEAVVKAAVAAFGGINHIVNNAGFTADKMLHTMSDDLFELILKVHNTAPFRLIKAAAPYLRSKDPKALQSNRSIVNVSSIAGLHGNVGQANYSTAKAGIIGLTKTIAREWGPFNVRCNCVAFGYIETRLTQAKELGESITVNGQKIALGIPSGPNPPKKGPVPGIPLGRPGSAQEAAYGVLFLLSPMASYVSGHTLEVTGANGI